MGGEGGREGGRRGREEREGRERERVEGDGREKEREGRRRRGRERKGERGWEGKWGGRKAIKRLFHHNQGGWHTGGYLCLSALLEMGWWVSLHSGKVISNN